MDQRDGQLLTLTTNIQKQQQDSKITNISKQVFSVYQQLHKAVDNMDEKVELVMKKHESQFLYAYKNHIKKIKKQLEQIKRKADEQQKIFSSNDRIRYLEKQVAIFRTEAIRLYDKLQKKQIQIIDVKDKIKDAEQQALKYREQKIELMKKLKMKSVQQLEYTQLIQKLTNQIEANKHQSATLLKKLHQQKQRNYMKQNIQNMGSQSQQQQQLTLTKNSSQTRQLKVYRNQLQQWFLECIRTVKKQIHLRKKNYMGLDLTNIHSIAEFQLVDKLKLFQLFLENQKLLNWFYHKIFPDRMDHVAQSLVDIQLLNSKSEHAGSQTNRNTSKSQRYVLDSDFHLPKVDEKNRIRNSLKMKNGRISLSSMQ